MPRQDDALSPAELAAQAAALADHLSRSGVQFLPAADPESVDYLRGGFAVAPLPDDSAPVGSSTPQSPPPLERTPPPTASNQPPPPQRSSSPSPPSPSPLVDAIDQRYPDEALSDVARSEALEVIAAEVNACVRCQQLASCRNHTVFGEGSPNPRVAFFGEGPGADEDRSGRPFVGKAGQLLTKMIEACGFQREDVYIFNTVKCRPPGNRNPEPDEIEHCREYFERQLAILRPEYIVCLGAVSSRALLRSKLSVGRLRGKLHRYFESKVLVTYHPAYLLRTPAAKKAAWDDLQLMLRDAGIDPRAASRR